MAVADPCAAPGRTPARPRPPTAKPSESSRMDLPAPVSPVRTLRPGANSSAACSIRTMSRTVSAASKAGPESKHLMESFIYPRLLVSLGQEIAPFQDVIGILVPDGAGIIGAQHGGGGLRLAVQPEGIIGL